jgi:hypothetical protein
VINLQKGAKLWVFLVVVKKVQMMQHLWKRYLMF